MKTIRLITLYILFSISSPASGESVQLPTGVIDRIAFGSCALEWLQQPVWDSILKQAPDLYISLGDAIYGDWDGSELVPVTVESLHGKWAQLNSRPEFQRIRSRVPMLATWDNHDYGSYDGGSDFILKRESKQIFLDFWDVPKSAAARHSPGIYSSHYFGTGDRRVQLILLDTRSFKSRAIKDNRSATLKKRLQVIGRYAADNSPGSTLLGDEQWQWLKKELLQPATLRILVSSTQVVADEKGLDEWGNFPLERKRLFELILETQAEGLVILSGNVHFSEMSRLHTFPYPLVDFTASGMTPENINTKYAKAINSYRNAGPYVDVNFGMLLIDWEDERSPLLTLRSHGVDGQIAFTSQFHLDELRFPAGENKK